MYTCTSKYRYIIPHVTNFVTFTFRVFFFFFDGWMISGLSYFVITGDLI